MIWCGSFLRGLRRVARPAVRSRRTGFGREAAADYPVACPGRCRQTSRRSSDQTASARAPAIHRSDHAMNAGGGGAIA